MDIYNVELKDTIELMNSENHKDRFKAEYIQTKIRYEKLHAMCIKYEAGVLDFTPKCPLYLLKEQKSCMGNYLKTLEIRAVLENIDLTTLTMEPIPEPEEVITEEPEHILPEEVVEENMEEPVEEVVEEESTEEPIIEA